MTAKSIADNFLNENFSVGRLCADGEVGEAAVKALLNILISDTVLFFQVGKNMEADQIPVTVSMILEDFKHFKPEDFKLCFTRGKKGHYGPLYDRFDGQVIMCWLMQYDADRDSEVEAIRARDNRQIKNETATPMLPAAKSEVSAGHEALFRTNFQKLKDSLNANKKAREEKAQAERKPIDKGPVYNMHQRWLQQFDDIHYLRPVNSKFGRFIKRYGRMLDKTAYLEHKQWQYQCIPALRQELHNKLNT